MIRRLGVSLLAFLGACASETDQVVETEKRCNVSLIVLGVAQDGGKPQIGNPSDPAWSDTRLRRRATSLAVIDHRNEAPARWLFEATPDIKSQIHDLNLIAPSPDTTLVTGVFLTHAHIGHYTGLMFFGHESAGAQNIITYVMPRMEQFLTANGPWNQLVKYHNIVLAVMEDGVGEKLGPDLSATPFLVPHRQEFSEVVGFKIQGPERSALFLPDIDSWEEWDEEGVRIEDMIAEVDIAFLDATFFADGEIPGRDMSGFPHPFVSHSMDRFANLPTDEKSKIRFIHMNHTNPLHNPSSAASKSVRNAGFNVAEEREVHCL